VQDENPSDDEKNANNVEVAEEAISLEANRIEFGNIGFISLGEGTADDNDNEVLADDKEHEEAAVDETHDSEKEHSNDPSGSKKQPAEVSGKKRAAADDTKQSKRRKKTKSAIESRKAAVDEKKKTKTKLPKTDAGAKKGFKDNFLTVKFKLSDIQSRAGKIPDFALFIKDDLHKPSSRNAVGHAGKYLAYMKGDICEKFFKKGIAFHPDEYYICDNEVDMKEDRLLPFKMSNIPHLVQQMEAGKKDMSGSDTEESSISGSSSSAEKSDSEESEVDKSDSEESEVDIYNTSKTAKKVSWGAPAREGSEESDSSGGVNVYGRGAGKSKSAEKKKKKSEKRKHFKQSSKKSQVDILDKDGFNGADHAAQGGSGVQGQPKGKGRGVRGQGKAHG
jgi:hypothetical protein